MSWLSLPRGVHKQHQPHKHMIQYNGCPASAIRRFDIYTAAAQGLVLLLLHVYMKGIYHTTRKLLHSPVHISAWQGPDFVAKTNNRLTETTCT